MDINPHNNEFKLLKLYAEMEMEAFDSYPLECRKVGWDYIDGERKAENIGVEAAKRYFALTEGPPIRRRPKNTY